MTMTLPTAPDPGKDSPEGEADRPTSTPTPTARTLAEMFQDRADPAADRSRLLLIFERAARAVAGLHAQRLMHPGLSPRTLRIDGAGRVEATGRTVPIPTDAGKGDSAALESPWNEALLDAPAYIAPELARADMARVDERADVFALGSILCELLTGGPAFLGDSVSKVRVRSARGEVADALKRLDNCGAPAPIVELAKDCLSVSLPRRPRDAGELADRFSTALASFIDRFQLADAKVREAVERVASAESRARASQRFGKRGILAMTILTLLLVGLAAAGAAWAVRWRQTRLGVVDIALNEALLRATFAAATPEGGLEQWAAAKEATERALKGLEGIPFAQRTRTQAEELARTINLGAVGSVADRLFIARLERARGGSDSPGAAHRAFETAFTQAGVDFAKLSPEEIGRQLLARSPRIARAGAMGLDYWSMIPRPNSRKADNSARSQRLAAARAADPDPWRNRVRDLLEREDQSACRQLWLENGFREQGPDTHNLYARVLLQLGETSLAIDVLEAIVNRTPGEYWANAALAELLLMPLRPRDRSAGATGTGTVDPSGATTAGPPTGTELARRAEPYTRAAVAARPDFLPAVLRLASVLATQGRIDEGIIVLTELAKAQPTESRPLHDLGQLLYLRGRLPDALTVFTKAVQLEPTDPRNQSGLGLSLLSAGKFEEALAALRESIRLDPASASTHANLGGALLIVSRLEEAAQAYREAIRLEPNFVVALLNLAIILEAQERPAEAVDLLQQAIRIAPNEALPRKLLGDLLTHSGKYDEALAAYDEVKRRNPGFTEIESARTAALRMKTLAPRLPAVIKGEDAAKDPAERLELARLCFERSYNVTAAKIFSEVLAADPKLAEDLKAANRYAAARAAARAGCGLGEDDPKPTDADRASWRARALDWLRADLSLRMIQYGSTSSVSRQEAYRTLNIWKADPAFSRVRNPDDLAKLPETERRDWQKLWSDVDRVVKPSPSS